uniref:Bacterial virulence protein VirB8 domain-containing protein n=2 Tax=Vibrionaceae TaxID=641 RepID=A0A0H3ZKN4_VIBSP|nr:hypothetical protein [Vibrio splendidus]AKN40558.1 hypothetical protein [Enterovibrio norvegicus]
MSKDNNDNDLPFDVWQTSRTAIIALSVGLVVSTVGFLGMSAVAAKLYVQKNKEIPVFLQVIDGDRQVVRIERSDGLMTIKQSTIIKSSAFRNYVLDREIVNHSDERDRFERVKMMSSNEVFELFSRNISPTTNPSSCFGDKRCKREVELKNDYQVKSAKNVWRVEFIVKDTFKGKPLKPQLVSATIQYTVNDSRIEYKDRYLNLSGIEIVSYQINPM